MKIAQVCYLYHPAIGGVESHVKNLSERLVSLGHTVEVFTSDFEDLQGKRRVKITREVVNGVLVKRYPGKFIDRRFTNSRFQAQKVEFGPIHEDLSKGNFDVIHVHSIPSKHFDEAYSVSKKLGCKIFVTAHFSPDDLVKAFKTKLTPWYWKIFLIPKLKKVNRFIAVSPSEAKAFASIVGLPEGKILVIPNGVNLEELDKVSNTKVRQFKDRYSPREPLILFVGRIVPAKGIDILVEAVASLRTRAKTLIVGPVGDERYFEELKRMVRRLKLESAVQFDELSRSEVLSAFHACDLFVLPTRGEVFGIVLAEAMAVGKVVIGANVGGIPDLIKDGKTGYLFEPGNYRDLRQKITQAIEYRDLSKKISLAGCKEVRNKYDWNKLASKLEVLYAGK